MTNSQREIYAKYDINDLDNPDIVERLENLDEQADNYKKDLPF